MGGLDIRTKMVWAKEVLPYKYFEQYQLYIGGISIKWYPVNPCYLLFSLVGE